MHRPAPNYLVLLTLGISLSPDSQQVAAQEPEPCTGYWAHHDASPGGTSMSCAVVVPDGRLFAGGPGTGLRVFRPATVGGGYIWTGMLGPVSIRITRLRLIGGELWVGTEGGVSVLDLATNQWRSYTTANSPLPSNLIRSLTRQGNTVWIGTAAGAARWRRVGQNETWNVLDAGDGFRPADADIRDIAVHRTLTTETIWIAGQSRLYTSIAGAPPVTEVGNTGTCRHETASRMLVDPQNDIWFRELNEVAGIRAEDGGGGAILVPTALCRHRPGATWTHFSDGLGFLVNDLALDSAGRLWAAMSGRAALHDQGTWCFCRQQDGTLFSDNVRAVATAGEGVWFGHGDAARMTFHSPNWSRVTTQQILNSSDPFAAVLHASGRIHAGVGNRIASSPGDTWSSVALPATALVSALGLDGAGQVCAGTASGVVYVQIAPTVFSPLAGPGLPAGGVRALASDAQGRLWAATPNGLALRGNGYWLPFTKADSGLGTNDLRALAIDAQGGLWIASDRGIYILSINAAGASTWSTFDDTTGLPSNDVRALAAGQGVVWAATAAGAAVWNGTSWSVHSAAGGALPGDDALAVTVDAAGRVWVGTTQGLARKEGSQWTHFHVTGSTLTSDRVTALAANGTQLWAANGTVLARRDEITGPIGFAPPTISSFTPTSGAPGVEVTINGTGFDARGLSYNYVTIGNTDIGGTGFPARAEVVSVTESRIVVRVPERATTGRIRVTAHELTAVSAASFTVRPAITGIGPTCVTLGTKLEVFGVGFLSGGNSMQIRLGSGPWRGVHSLTATHIDYFVRAGDKSGEVRIKTANGVEVAAPAEVTFGTVELFGTPRIQQAIQGVPLVCGKRTLIHIDLFSGDCKARITGGHFEWKRSDGSFHPGQRGAYLAAPGGSSALVTSATPIDSRLFGVDFVERTPEWPLLVFAGGRVVLTQNGIEVFVKEFQRSDFNFVEVSPPPTLIAIGVRAQSGGSQYRDFWDTAWASLEHVARMCPAREAVRWGPDPWITWTPTYFRVPAAYLGAAGDVEDNENLDNNYCDIKAQADDIVDPDFGEYAMALVDGALYQEGARGKAPIGPSLFSGLTGVSFNFVKKDGDGELAPGRSATGPIIAQEFGHMLGLVDDDASNHDRSNEYHSRFDEGEGVDPDDEDCAKLKRLSFRAALEAQLGTTARRVVRLDAGAPFDHPLSSCAPRRPRSVMSYVPDKTNYRGHLEPADHSALRAAFAFLDLFGLGGGGAGQGRLSASAAPSG